MNASEARKEAQRILALLEKNFLLPDGSFLLERSGDTVRAFHIFPDLGDVLPFLYYFDAQTLAETQVARYQAVLHNGYLVSQFPSLGVPGLVKSYEYTDLLFGLLAHVEERPSDEARTLLLTQAVQKVRTAFLRGGALRSFFHPALNIRLPVVDTRDATLAECLVDIYRWSGDTSHLDDARTIVNQILATRFYKKYGLFGDYEPAGVFASMILARNPKATQATLCKNTTNTLFALLALHQAAPTEEVYLAIQRVLRAVQLHATTSDGGIIERWHPGDVARVPHLTSSFPLIDFLCDFSRTDTAHAEEHLSFARRIADFWISVQGATGLFPLRPDSKGSFFDSETDMYIALTKLGECTGSLHYKEAALRCLAGIVTWHGAHAYPLSVDCMTGEVIDTTQRTKFLTLFLKALILVIEQEMGARIYTSSYLFNVLKDR